MGAQALAILSERESGQAVLSVLVSNVDGAQDHQCSLPAGFGDCYIIRSAVQVQSALTMMVDPQNFGPAWYLLTPSLAVADAMGVERWTRSYAAFLAAEWAPLLAVLWREGEQLSIQHDEVDTNVAPTADVRIVVVVQRRQNMPTRPGPIPLVLTS